jgi:hydrogenase nickel incorporation protein HypB
VGRFHRHDDGSDHDHDHDHDHHDHDHDHDHDHLHDHGSGPAHRDVGDHRGYTDTGTSRVSVLEHILSENDRVADANRAALGAAGVRTVNLMSSPGAGKTALLKRTLTELAGRVRIGVLEGDIATSLDADELSGLGAEVALVNTSAGFGGECHLDAVMVRSGLARLPLAELDLLVIENVGNLVCPAEFDVGQDVRAMVYAITEGEEKPLKYPVMFHAVDVVVVNKLDLLPHLDFDLDRFLANVRAVNPAATVIQLSARTGDGTAAWYRWLLDTLPPGSPGSDDRS